MPDGKAAQGLRVVEVVPVIRGLAKPSLSYFTTRELAPGTLVRVPVRNTLAQAIVTSSRDAAGSKTDIKSSSFTLRKIRGEDILDTELPQAFMRAAEKTALYYASSTGAVLAQLLPKIFLDKPEYFFPPASRDRAEEIQREPLLLQLEQDERYAQYKALVRQAFAHSKSVMFVTPTYEDARRIYSFLSKGIAEFTYLFTLDQRKKVLMEMWKKAGSGAHPVLFITTSSGVVFNREDLAVVVLERENSRGYRTLSRPYISLKVFLENLAREARRELVLGDSVLSVETLWRKMQGETSELSSVKWRLDPSSITTLVDMKNTGKSEKTAPTFEIFSPELKKLIKIALSEKKGIFLFGARKGLSPTTLCGDCGAILSCKECGAPVVLHESGFVCHACGARRGAETRCDYCTSWNLKPIGIGVDRIAKETRRLFPRTKIQILDRDHAPQDKEVKRIISEFESKGGVLVGTELALLYLDKTEYSAAVSVDALFSIPDIGIEERVFYLLSRLREITKKECVIQTRNIGKQVLAWAAAGNILDFYKAEIEERRGLGYPPFSVFIKITAPGIENLRDEFSKWKPDFIRDSMILRVPKEAWPQKELVSKLSLLPPSFSIKVDPEGLL